MACCPERFTNDDSDRGVAALDRSRSQEYLAHQCCPRRQVPKRPGLQVPHCGLVIVDGKRDPGQQQAASGGGQPAGKLDGGAQVLYDVSSAAFEGRTCPLGAIGHPKDGVRGRLQIVYGLSPCAARIID